MMSKLAILLLALVAVVGSFPVKESNTTDSATDSATDSTTGQPLLPFVPIEWKDTPQQYNWSDIRSLYKTFSSMGSNRTHDQYNEIMESFDHMELVQEQMKRRDEERKVEREGRERQAKQKEDKRQIEYRNSTHLNLGSFLFVGFLSIVFLIAFIYTCTKSPAIATLICCGICSRTEAYRLFV